MKEYTLKELAMEVTSSNEKDYNWDSGYESIRRIQELLKELLGDEPITDINKDKYIRVYKLIYNNQDIKSVISKWCKIKSGIEITDGTMHIPYSKKNMTNEEYNVVLKVLLEFYKGENKEAIINRIIDEINTSEIVAIETTKNHNYILSEIELEIKKINTSIQGYSYEEKIEKMKEIKEYLKNQRMEIDKNIMENSILHYE